MNDRYMGFKRASARIQAFLLVATLAFLMILAGWLLGGAQVAWAAVIVVMGLFWMQPLAAPRIMLRIHGGRPLSPAEAPGLHRMVRALTRQAGLARSPQLYYLPGRMMNAFTTGSRDHAIVGVSDGLLRNLDRDEVAAVMAHEIAHIHNNDTRLMGFAALLSQLIQGMSLFGQLLLIINLPLILAGHQFLSLGGILVLILAPYVGLLLQLALSRSREYLADAEAAAFMGSPRPLATALARIERYHHGLRRHLWRWPGFNPAGNPLLRTHPPTRERIRRLLAIEDGRMTPAPMSTFSLGAPPVYRRQKAPARLVRCRAYGPCP